MKSVLAKQPDNTVQLTISIPQDEVKKTREAVIDQMVQNAELPGFRKGKAPRKMVEEKLNPEKIQEEVLKNLLPKHYIAAVQEHKIQPIMNPKIHVEKLSPDAAWEFSATTAEAPIIDVSKYKDAVQNVTARSKITIPGKETVPAKFEDIMKVVVENVQVTLPKILIEQEVDRMLSLLLQDIQRLGLTLDQYIASSGKTVDDLRADYEKKVASDLTIEFALQKIAEVEKITVSEKDIDEAIQKAKDEKERKNLQEHRPMLANILKQQKTLDFIKNL